MHPAPVVLEADGWKPCKDCVDARIWFDGILSCLLFSKDVSVSRLSYLGLQCMWQDSAIGACYGNRSPSSSSMCTPDINARIRHDRDSDSGPRWVVLFGSG
jgi:hypothetical protein